MAIISKEISEASLFLRIGQLVGIPTETVYGLAANATDTKAVVKIFETKNRPDFDPLIVHIGIQSDINKFGQNIHPKILEITKELWPGPLTVVVEKSDLIPDIVTSGLDTVGIRMPNHPLTLELLRSISFPLAAPSANPFGYISPTSAQHVDDQLGEKIPLILDGGACDVGVESTIIQIVDDEIHVLRWGGIDEKQLSKFGLPIISASHSTSKPNAPGQLTSHYAPRIPFFLGDMAELEKGHLGKKIGRLYWNTKGQSAEDRTLSLNSSLNEAAHNLFGFMRELDSLQLDVILAEPVPHEGIGKAINDRLKRAASMG
jgi:L-threonylcarbamoyladenylate synthase